MHTYSLNEQVVGTWVDGKPVYETTYYVDNLVRNDTWRDIATIPSLGRIIKLSVAGLYSSGNQGDVNLAVSYNQPQIQATSSGTLQYAILSRTGLSDFYLIVRYTKTTD